MSFQYTHNVLDELGTMPPDRLDGLENVNFAMLDHLLDACVGRAVNTGAGMTVTKKEK